MVVRHARPGAHAADDDPAVGHRDAGAVPRPRQRRHLLRLRRARLLVLRYAALGDRVDDGGFLRDEEPRPQLRRAVLGMGCGGYSRTGHRRPRLHPDRRLPLRVLLGISARAHRARVAIPGENPAAGANYVRAYLQMWRGAFSPAPECPTL